MTILTGRGINATQVPQYRTHHSKRTVIPVSTNQFRTRVRQRQQRLTTLNFQNRIIISSPFSLLDQFSRGAVRLAQSLLRRAFTGVTGRTSHRRKCMLTVRIQRSKLCMSITSIPTGVTSKTLTRSPEALNVKFKVSRLHRSVAQDNN